jgi:hypothetical protein
VRHSVSVTPPTPGGRYAIGPDEDITEYFDEPTVLHKKVSLGQMEFANEIEFNPKNCQIFFRTFGVKYQHIKVQC